MINLPQPSPKAARVAWIIYTTALLTATHWPGLTIKGPIDRTDLIIHAGVFCIWTCLLYATRWIGGCTCGTRRLVWTGVAAICFATFDESTQPLFRRVFDWWDLAADYTGVLLALALLTATQRIWPRFRSDPG